MSNSILTEEAITTFTVTISIYFFLEGGGYFEIFPLISHSQVHKFWTLATNLNASQVHSFQTFGTIITINNLICATLIKRTISVKDLLDPRPPSNPSSTRCSPSPSLTSPGWPAEISTPGHSSGEGQGPSHTLPPLLHFIYQG